MELHRDGETLPFTPQPAQVLALLLTKPGRLVTREELQRKVWAGRVVEFDAGLNFAIMQIRKALGDQAQSPTYVETVRRRGYRFIGRIEEGGRVEGGAPAEAGSGPRPPKTITVRWMVAAAGLILLLSGGTRLWRATLRGSVPTGPRLMLAILPFRQIGPADSIDFFSEGLTEELITDAANLSPDRLGVIAPTSVVRFEARSLDPVSNTLNSELSYIFTAAGRNAEAIRQCTATLELTPAVQWAHWCLFTAHYFDGNLASAAAEVPGLMRRQDAPEERIASLASSAPDRCQPANRCFHKIVTYCRIRY